MKMKMKQKDKKSIGNEKPLTKEERERELMEKEMQYIVKEELDYIVDLVNRFNLFYTHHKARLKCVLDIIGWPVKYEMFLMALNDLGASFLDFDVYILFRMLVPNRNDHVINEWTDMVLIMWQEYHRLKVSKPKEMSGEFVISRPRWTNLNFYPMNQKSHRLTEYNKTLPDTLPSFALHNTISSHNSCVTKKIQFFNQDTSLEPMKLKTEQEILRDIGYKGGIQRNRPNKYKIYYDCDIGFVDCPLLKIDSHPCRKSISAQAEFTQFV